MAVRLARTTFGGARHPRRDTLGYLLYVRLGFRFLRREDQQ